MQQKINNKMLNCFISGASPLLAYRVASFTNKVCETHKMKLVWPNGKGITPQKSEWPY